MTPLGFALCLAFWIAVSLPAPRAAALTWTRVEEVPASDIYSLQLHGSTLYAGGTDRVYVGASDGTTWTETAVLDPGVTSVQAVAPAGGALWAGTYGQGVYRSTNGGTSWNPVSGGLDGLGATYVIALAEKSGKLYAGTSGAGVYVLDLATPTLWAQFNDGFPVFTAGNVSTLLLHGTTLIAPAGGNGYVYRFPDGATAWQEVAIVPPIAPGLLATDLVASGNDLLLGAAAGTYRSDDDAQSWTFAGNGLLHGTEVLLAVDGSVFLAGIDFLGNNHRLYRSADRGDSWQQFDEVSGAFLYSLEVAGGRLFAARQDGLWWVPLAATQAQGASWGGFKNRFRD